MEDALAATQAIPFTIGTVLVERYELRALLGEGGMGAVFRAYDRELDEDVALKVLHPEVASDVAALTRFRREVKLARRVTHRNVARTFDLGAHEGLRFLTMELIDGESLAACARRARLSFPEVLRVAAEIARGLCAAHVVGVVHRDLKPDNVMLSEDRVVLTDFGIARVADGSADVMRTGMVVGTPAYMAPEQLENQAVDGRTDVYALGTMLFELLTGKLPFDGATAFSIAAQRMTADAPDVRSVAPNVSDGVAALVKEMLARRREDRPDAQAVLDRIEALRGNGAGIRRAVSKLPTLTSETLSSIGQPRTVAVEALVGTAETATLAPLLTSAIVDALTESRAAHRVSTDKTQADLVVSGTLHASGDRVRARMRVVGRTGSSVWAGHVDGSVALSLDFEDGVVHAVTEAVRMQTARDPGPADPSLREAYDKAQVEFQAFVLPRMRSAIAILEDIETKKPGDPRVRTLLARALMSVWAQTGAHDRVIVERAEELALRALEADPTIAAAYHLVAQVRFVEGELAYAIRADEETLRRDPRNAEAHMTLGALMCEALHVAEGRRRLELAARLEPTNTQVAFSRINVLGLLDEREKARAVLAELVKRAGPLAGVIPMSRLAVWWHDLDLAAEAADIIEATRVGASWDPAAIIMRSLISGKAEPRAPGIFAELTSRSIAPRRRATMHEIGADYYASLGNAEGALQHIEALARLPSTNLLWLDACAPFALVRKDPRFAEARAMVAARCADLWGAVGGWPQEGA